ncbi:hypothetical protein [Maricaulis parjimensis]|uniref:hypothetical protein n=1 Tax=Maricaulis parjimensis TaxID=144023 RepID=UPI001939D3B2|nr:hypothetical protein [Maricaulis parjimensis]
MRSVLESSLWVLIVTLVPILISIIAYFRPNERAGFVHLWRELVQWLGVRNDKFSIDILTRFDIPDIRNEVRFFTEGGHGARLNDIKTALRPRADRHPIAHDEEAVRITANIVRERIERGQTCDNNGSFACNGFRVERRDSGPRTNRYTFFFEETDFYRFLYPNLCLDEKIDFENGRATPRQRYGLDRSVLSLDAAYDLDCQFRGGTTGVLLTSDNAVILSLRSASQAIVPHGFHLSVAEGMYRSLQDPSASDCYHREPNPFITIQRAMGDELGLLRKEVADTDLELLSVVTDTLRAEALFLFFGVLPLDRYAVAQRWMNSAEDRHENRDIVMLDWKRMNIQRLLEGADTFEFPVFSAREGKTVLLKFGPSGINFASNHARAGMAFAYQRSFGVGA